MEPKKITSITDISTDGAVSVLSQTFIVYNGQEIAIGNHREALVPGQFDRAKEILQPNQYNAIIALWTPEIIEAWEEKQSALNLVDK